VLKRKRPPKRAATSNRKTRQDSDNNLSSSVMQDLFSRGIWLRLKIIRVWLQWSRGHRMYGRVWFRTVLAFKAKWLCSGPCKYLYCRSTVQWELVWFKWQPMGSVVEKQTYRLDLFLMWLYECVVYSVEKLVWKV